jgi:hypothetical protein
MGSFERSGAFKDREKFLAGVKEKLAKVVGGPGQGMTSTWEKAGADDVGRLAGFGVKVELTVSEGTWRCTAEIPPWLPIPQSLIEQKFDEKFSDLSKL